MKRRITSRSKKTENVSIKDVARIAGVSIATVSRCLNTPDKVAPRTRDNVQQAILDTGYSPDFLARSFRQGRSNIVIVVAPAIRDPFCAAILAGIRTAATESGYSILIEEQLPASIVSGESRGQPMSAGADGIILLTDIAAEHARFLSSSKRGERMPVVIGCDSISVQQAVFSRVHIDNVASAKLGAEYLINAGHERIAMISGPKGSVLAQERELGFLHAMRAARLEVPEEWIVEAGMTLECGMRGANVLLSAQDRPTAILCVNDEMALGCLHAAREKGFRVPGDLSLLGFDGIRYTAVSDPPLTTIARPAEEIGRCLMHRIDIELNSPAPVEIAHDIVPYELIERASVAAPPTKAMSKN